MSTVHLRLRSNASGIRLYTIAAREFALFVDDAVASVAFAMEVLLPADGAQILIFGLLSQVIHSFYTAVAASPRRLHGGAAALAAVAPRRPRPKSDGDH